MRNKRERTLTNCQCRGQFRRRHRYYVYLIIFTLLNTEIQFVFAWILLIWRTHTETSARARKKTDVQFQLWLLMAKTLNWYLSSNDYCYYSEIWATYCLCCWCWLGKQRRNVQNRKGIAIQESLGGTLNNIILIKYHILYLTYTWNISCCCAKANFVNGDAKEFARTYGIYPWNDRSLSKWQYLPPAAVVFNAYTQALTWTTKDMKSVQLEIVAVLPP